MPRFLPYLIIGIAFAASASAIILSSTMIVSPTRIAIVTPHASSTSPVLNSIATSTGIVSTSTPKKSTLPKTVSVSPTPTSAPAPLPEPVPVLSVTEQNALLDTAATTLRAALVNILCYAPAKSGFSSISGSGIIIDPKGIILTNAHIAQYFLLADRNVSCDIRSGGPATNRYEATLIYISPLWLTLNATVLTETLPNGTGEYDFAFLAISKSATSNPLPDAFPYLPLATMPPAISTPVVIASYGAQFLESSQIRSSLFPTIVFGSIKDIFTFKMNTIDVLALGGSVAAQEGSSGGGVADASGKLVGTITTSTVSGATDTRSLSAISASYIRAEYANETGRALDLLLAKPTDTSINDFASQIKTLEAIITANLPN